MAGATFYGDLGCPWTWLASRWLVDVAAACDFEVRWRALPLATLDDEHAAQRHYQQTRRALRVVEGLAARGDDRAAGSYWTAYGTELHHAKRRADDELALAAGTAAGVGDVAEMLDDDALGDAVAAALEEAQTIAGPNVGSPVLQVGDAPRGFFGPVLTALPRGGDAVALWRALEGMAGIAGFSELKRGRIGGPDLGSARP